MFSDDDNFPKPKLAPNSSSDVNVMEIMLYLGVDKISFASSVENIDCNHTTSSHKIDPFMVVRIHSKRG